MNDDQTHPTTLENSIAQAPLHNTADAMGILAQVSNELDPDKASRAQQNASRASIPETSNIAHGEIHYQPLGDGSIARETILELFRR